jgi:hypothetical protein
MEQTTEQMMAFLLAEIRTHQAEMKANSEERNAEMKAMQEKTDANLKEMTERLEAKIGTSQEKMDHNPIGFPRLPDRCPSRRDEGHAGCLTRKDGGKSRRNKVQSGV